MILAAKAPSSSTLEIPQVQNLLCFLHFSTNPEAIFDEVSWLVEIWNSLNQIYLSSQRHFVVRFQLLCLLQCLLRSCWRDFIFCQIHESSKPLINGGLVRGPFQSDENSHRNVWVRLMGCGMSMWHCSLILSLFIFLRAENNPESWLEHGLDSTSNVIDIGNESPYDDPIRGSFCRK